MKDSAHRPLASSRTARHRPNGKPHSTSPTRVQRAGGRPRSLLDASSETTTSRAISPAPPTRTTPNTRRPTRR